MDIDSLTDDQIRQIFPKLLERYKKIEGKPYLLKLSQLDDEVNQLLQLRDSLQSDVTNLEGRVHELEQKILETDRISRELEQQKIILNTVSSSFENNALELEKSHSQTEQKLQEKEHQTAESEQSKLLLQVITKSESTKRKFMQRKYYVALALCVSILVASVAAFTIYEKMRDDQRENILSGALKGKFTVKNLNGETVNTWATWNIVNLETLYVGISNPEKISQDKIDVIKDTILSMETVQVEKPDKGSSALQYYKGWKGALEKASQTRTEFYIPAKIEVSEAGEGDIIIHLTNDLDMDGNAGYTNSIIDQNNILQATITIYLAQDLTDERFAIVVRHEFGHALGLGHSTDPEDLMAPVTATEYPYISECDINTIISLYNNVQSSDVVCEKEMTTTG